MTQDDRLELRIASELKEEAERQAKSAGCTLSEYIRRRLAGPSAESDLLKWIEWPGSDLADLKRELEKDGYDEAAGLLQEALGRLRSTYRAIEAADKRKPQA